MSNIVNVSAAFAETEILLTGAGGFLGKVLIALLLDRFPEIKRLHVLVRPRRGKSAAERFRDEALASPPLRDVVARRGEDFLKRKIRVWEGDASASLTELAEKNGPPDSLGLILNCAGLVEFFPPADESLRANVDAVERMLELAERTGAKLLHVSTCYVAGRSDGVIEESEPIAGFYPRRRGPGDASFDAPAEIAALRERIAEIATDGGGEDARRAALADLGRERAARWGWVNTYTFTKSLGEQLVAARPDIPSTIVRPAIVESALEFPFAGWIEGGRTAAPLILMALGGMKRWPARADLSLEVIPVDMVAAGILIAGAMLIEGRAAPVYQLAASDVNPFEMAPLLALLDDEARRRETNGGSSEGRLRIFGEAAYRRHVASTRSRARRSERRLLRWAERLAGWKLPGSTAARARAAAMRRLSLQAAFRERTIEQYLPFILDNRYLFECRNIREAVAAIRPEDRQALPWAPEAIDWNRYWRENQIDGVLRWVRPEAIREWSFQI